MRHIVHGRRLLRRHERSRYPPFLNHGDILARHCTIAHVLVVLLLCGWLCRRILLLWLSHDVTENLQGVKHGAREKIGILLRAKIQAVHLFVVAPLMKRRRCLIIFEPLKNCAVDDHFMVLQLATDNAKRLLNSMLVDVHLGQTRGAARRHPFLIDVIVDHHARTSARYRLLTHLFSWQTNTVRLSLKLRAAAIAHR